MDKKKMFPKFPLSLFMRSKSSKVPAKKGNNNTTTTSTNDSTGNGNENIGEGDGRVPVRPTTTPPPLTPSKASTPADPSGGSYPGLIVQKLNNNGASKIDCGRSESVPAFGPVTVPSPVRVPPNSSPTAATGDPQKVVKFILIPTRPDPTPTTSRAHTLLAIPTYSKKPAAVVSHNSAPAIVPVPVAADEAISVKKRVGVGARFALAASKLSLLGPLVKKRKRSSSPAAAAAAEPDQQDQHHQHIHISLVRPAEQPHQQTLSGRRIKQKKVFDPSDCLYEKSPKREGGGGKKVTKEQQPRNKGSTQQLPQSERSGYVHWLRRQFLSKKLVKVKVEPEEVLEEVEENFDDEREEETTNVVEEAEVETKKATPPANNTAPAAIAENAQVEEVESEPTSTVSEPKVPVVETVTCHATAAAAGLTAPIEPIQQQQMSPTAHDNNMGNVDIDSTKQIKVQYCDKETQTTSGLTGTVENVVDSRNQCFIIMVLIFVLICLLLVYTYFSRNNSDEFYVFDPATNSYKKTTCAELLKLVHQTY